GHVADQSGENRAMNGVVSGVAFIELQRAEIIERVVELRVKILPLAHAQIRKEMLFAEATSGALRAQFLPLIVNGIPDVEQREEVGTRIVEPFMRGHSGLFLVHWTFARILDAEAGGDDEEFARGMFLLRLQQHAAKRRINRQSRQIATKRRQ